MAQREDILAGAAVADATPKPLRVRIAAFVPLTIALLGISAILLGGISARHDTTASVPAVDSIATGSIAKD